MTCIVGVARQGRVVLGADSLAARVFGEYTHEKSSKIFRVGSLLIGGTTSWRFLQLIEFSLAVPRRKKSWSEREWLVRGFIKPLRILLGKEWGKDAGQDKEAGGELLVATRGHLYEIGCDYSVLESEAGYAAVGAGAPFALGGMFMEITRFYAEQGTISRDDMGRIAIAGLQTAAAHSVWVRAPFSLFYSDGGKESGFF